MTTTLHKPTVAELVRILNKFPPDTPVEIEDADTNWRIVIIHVEDRGQRIVLFGDYQEMEST